ncbi:MAG: hypothetical protein ACRCXC_11775 [Legionella sp.]
MGNVRKFEAVKKAFKAIEDYENVINENKSLTETRRAEIKNYIHSKINLYKKVFSDAQMQKPEVFYRVLFRETEHVFVLSSDIPNKDEFFKHLISKAVLNLNFFSDVYEYFSHERQNSGALLKKVFSQAMEVIDGDSILNDPEITVVYQSSLRQILLKECEKTHCNTELIVALADAKLTGINTTLFIDAYAAMKEHKSEGTQSVTLKSLLGSIVKNSEFLDLFVRKKKEQPQGSTFLKQRKEFQGASDLAAFFKTAAECVIENTGSPVTQEKVRLHLDKMFASTTERTVDQNKAKIFLELYCYKQLLDAKKINTENKSSWRNLPGLVNECKQISYCCPEAMAAAEDVLVRYRKLNHFSQSTSLALR